MELVKKTPEVMEGYRKENELFLVTLDGDEAFFKVTGEYIKVWDLVGEEGIALKNLLQEFPEKNHTSINQFLGALKSKGLIDISG